MIFCIAFLFTIFTVWETTTANYQFIYFNQIYLIFPMILKSEEIFLGFEVWQPKISIYDDNGNGANAAFHILCKNARLIIVNSKPRWDIYAIYNSLRNKMNLLDDTFLIKLQNLFIMRHRVTLKYFFHVTVVKSLHFSLKTSCKSFNWWNLQLLLVNSKIMLVTEGMSYPKMVVSMKLPYNDFYPCHYMVCHLKIISRNELTGDLRIVLCVQKCFQKALKWQLAWIEMKYKIFA